MDAGSLSIDAGKRNLILKLETAVFGECKLVCSTLTIVCDGIGRDGLGGIAFCQIVMW